MRGDSNRSADAPHSSLYLTLFNLLPVNHTVNVPTTSWVSTEVVTPELWVRGLWCHQRPLRLYNSHLTCCSSRFRNSSSSLMNKLELSPREGEGRHADRYTDGRISFLLSASPQRRRGNPHRFIYQARVAGVRVATACSRCRWANSRDLDAKQICVLTHFGDSGPQRCAIVCLFENRRVGRWDWCVSFLEAGSVCNVTTGCNNGVSDGTVNS